MIEKPAQSAGSGGRRWRMAIWCLIVLLLSASYVSTLFTGKGSWTAFDYLVFGAMLAVAGGGFEIATSWTSSRWYHMAVALAVCTAMILVWVNLAVGIIGNEGNQANVLYACVIAIGLTGAALARLRPQGMSNALVATALAQGIAALIALAAGWGQTFGVTTFFVSLWLLSAYLFYKSIGDR